jgi:hypothetical protein
MSSEYYVITNDEVADVQKTQETGEAAVGAGQGGFPLGLPNEDYPKKLTREQINLLAQCFVSNGLRVSKDSTNDLSYIVEAGTFMYRGEEVSYAGASAQAVTANQTNYIYLDLTTGSPVLTKSTSSFPADSGVTPHIRLAQIAAGASAYAYDDITDKRMANFIHVLGDAGGAYLDLSGTDDADGTGTMDIQVKTVAGDDIAGRYKMTVWLSTTQNGLPIADTDFSITTGGEIYEFTANAYYAAQSDATGLVVMNIDLVADDTVWVMAEIDGQVYTGSIAITGN